MTSKQDGYLDLGPVFAGAKLKISYYASPFLENRRLERLALPSVLPANVTNVVVRLGPSVLMNEHSSEIQNVALNVGADGNLLMPDTAGMPKMTPWYQLINPEEPHAFLFNVRLNSNN